MLFENNAEIAGRYFDLKPGALCPGAAADVIVLDYDPLTPMRADNLNGHILFGMNGRSVTATVINGEVKMKNRELLCADEAEIMANCRTLAGKLADRMNGR
jgi:cytosine/adenosine deaminase-related metal-dependent hydrolase